MMLILYIAGYIFAGAVVGMLLYRRLKTKLGDGTAIMVGLWGGALWPISFIIDLGFWFAGKLAKRLML